MLSTMSSDKILKIVGGRNALRLSGSKEVLHDWVCVVSERDFDRTFETVDIPVVGCTLVCLMFLHKRN